MNRNPRRGTGTSPRRNGASLPRWIPTLGALVLALAAVVLTRVPTAAQQGQALPTCDSEQHRQFDFWVGDWEVMNPRGQKVGENNVTLIQNGCALHEDWHGAGGGTGESFNIYDRTRDVWHQTWVSGIGMLLELEGGLNDDGAMVLRGQSITRQGTVQERVTWSKESDGRVRQLWERSSDGGSTWAVVFDGMYVRKDTGM